MPIPVINYSAQQPQGWDADFLGALSKGLALGFSPYEKREDLKTSRLANNLSELRNKYAPQRFEDEQRQAGLANALNQVALQYAPQNAEASLQSNLLNNAMGAFNLQQAPREAELDQRGKDIENQLGALNLQYLPQERETGLRFKQEELKQLPLKNIMDRIKLQQGAMTLFNQTLKNMPESNRADIQAQNAEAFNQMINALGNQALGGAINPESFALNLTPAQEQNLVNQGIASFSSSPEDIDRQRKAAQIAANNALNTTNNRQQMEGVIQLESYINNPEFLRKAESAAGYAGAMKSGKFAIEKYLRRNPNGFADYESFTKHDLLGFKNRLSQAEGMSKSAESQKELNEMFGTIDNFNSNPERFMAQLSRLNNTVRRVGESVEESYNKLGYPSQLPEQKDLTFDIKSRKLT